MAVQAACLQVCALAHVESHMNDAGKELQQRATPDPQVENHILHPSVLTKKYSNWQKHCRRKFRSQTSDNMDRWKSGGATSQRRERKKTEGAGARKGRKVAKQVIPLFCGSRGSKSRPAGGCGAIWSDERSKIARGCGAKHMLKSK